MKYPTIEEVAAADMEQVRQWWRYLSSPGSDAVGCKDAFDRKEREEHILSLIHKRFETAGEKPPKVSMAVGHAAMTIDGLKQAQRLLECSDNDLARLIRARPDTLRRWKNGLQPMPPYIDVLLPLLVRLDARDCTIDELRIIAGLADDTDTHARRD